MTLLIQNPTRKKRKRRNDRSLQKVTVVLPRELVERLDGVAPNRKRSKFIENAILEQIQLAEQFQALEETAGLWKDEDYPRLLTEEDVDRWLSDLRQGWNRSEWDNG